MSMKLNLKMGIPVKPLKKIGKTKKNGTRITFLPSKKIFSSVKFSTTILEKRIRELAFLNKGIAVKLVDNTSKKPKNSSINMTEEYWNLSDILIIRSQY